MAQYPSSVPTDQDLYIAVNNKETFLTAGITGGSTSLPVNSTVGFPPDGVVGIGTEAIHYSSADATNFLGLTRGFDGTGNAPHSINDEVVATVVAAHHNSIKDEAIAVTTDLFAAISADLDDSLTPVATATSIKNRLDQLASVLSDIIGADWKATPADTVLSLDGRVTTNAGGIVTNTGDISDNTDEINNNRTNLKNILVNGGQEIWLRDISFTNPANDTNVSDEWIFFKSGTVAPTVDILRSATVDVSGKYSAAFSFSAAGSGSPRAFMQQQVKDFEQFRGRTVSVHARVRSNAVGVKVLLQDGTQSVYSSSHTGGGAYETLTATMVISVSSTNLNCSIGFIDSDVSAVAVFIDNVMLTNSDTPIAYVPEDPAIELERCLRYYQKSAATHLINHPIQRFSGNNEWATRVDFTTEMSATPSVTTVLVGFSEVHLPTTGNGAASVAANWAGLSATPDKRGFKYSGQRDVDQTTYPCGLAQFTYIAEV